METKHENNDDQLAIEQINKTKNMKKKKVSRGMHVLSVVLFMLRRRPRTKPINTSFWRRMIESVRKSSPSTITTMPSSNSLNTMCLPPPPPPPPLEVAGKEEEGDDNNDDDGDSVVEVFTEASSSSRKTGISGYGSAMCLRDLGYNDNDDEDDDDDEDDSDEYVEGGDDMIDEKAEEFIMRFYEQMKMQNQVYTERCRSKSG